MVSASALRLSTSPWRNPRSWAIQEKFEIDENDFRLLFEDLVVLSRNILVWLHSYFHRRSGNDMLSSKLFNLFKNLSTHTLLYFWNNEEIVEYQLIADKSTTSFNCFFDILMIMRGRLPARIIQAASWKNWCVFFFFQGNEEPTSKLFKHAIMVVASENT